MFLWTRFLHLPKLRKTLKQLTKISVPHGCSNLLQDVCLVADTTFTKITCVLISPITSLEQFLRAVSKAVSQAIVLSKTLNKLDSQHLLFFFKVNKCFCVPGNMWSVEKKYIHKLNSLWVMKYWVFTLCGCEMCGQR